MPTFKKLAALVLLFAVSTAHADCNPMQRARALIQEQLWSQVEAQLPAAQTECHSGERVALSVLAAKTCYQALATGPERSETEFHEEIRRCSTLGPAWEIQYALCKSQAERRERAPAMQSCAIALEQINDRSATPEPQPEAEAEVAVLLADQMAVGSVDGFPEVITRGDVAGGVMGLITRGMGVRPWPTPLHFSTGTNLLTTSGEAAYKVLLSALKERCKAVPALIKLEGYADPRGSIEVNRELSRQRAASIQARLKKDGLACPVISEGRGVFPNSSLDPENLGHYTQQERWQLMRSVRLSAAPAKK